MTIKQMEELKRHAEGIGEATVSGVKRAIDEYNRAESLTDRGLGVLIRLHITLIVMMVAVGVLVWLF